MGFLTIDKEAAEDVDKARADFLKNPTVDRLDQFKVAMNTLKQQSGERVESQPEMLEVSTGGRFFASRYIHLGQVFNPVVTERILT